MPTNRRDPGRTSASRLLAVLAAFDPSQPTMTLSELASASDLPLATAHRLAAELVQWGALERDTDGRFQIGLRLWQVGTLAPRHHVLRSTALPFMGDLHEATAENVQLAVAHGLLALPIDKISGRRSVRNVTAIAGPLPLHATGVGKVILAYSGPQLFEDVVAAGLTPYTPRTIVVPGLLAKNIAAVRRTGAAFSYEEMTIGACSVAAPIFDANERLLAALAIVVHARTDVTRLVSAVRAAATSITRTLAT